MQEGQPGVRKPSARPTPAIISVFRPFRYFVKVGGIAEEWMALHGLPNSNANRVPASLTADWSISPMATLAPKRCRPVAVARPIPQAPPVMAHSVAAGVPGVAAEANR
jgi:hypothetical protein